MSRKKDENYKSVFFGDEQSPVEEDAYIDEFSVASEKKQDMTEENGKPTDVVKEEGDYVWVKIPPEMLCKDCKEKERDISKGEDFPYCKECAKQRYRYPFSALVLLLAAVIIGVSVFSGMQTVTVAENAQSIHAADEFLSESKLYSAGTAYAELFDKDGTNKYVTKRLVEILYKSGKFENIVTLIDEVFSASDLKGGQYKKIGEIRKEVSAYNAAYNTINEYVNSISTEATYEEVTAKLDEYASIGYQPACLDFFRYKCAVLFHEDVSVQYSMIMQAFEENPQYTWLYLPAVASAERRIGQYDSAIASSERLLIENAENSEGYFQLAAAYLLKGDYEKVEGFASSSYLLRANEDAGNLLLVAFHLLGKKDEYESFLMTMYEDGFEPAMYVERIAAGEATVEDIYLKGVE